MKEIQIVDFVVNRDRTRDWQEAKHIHVVTNLIAVKFVVIQQPQKEIWQFIYNRTNIKIIFEFWQEQERIIMTGNQRTITVFPGILNQTTGILNTVFIAQVHVSGSILGFLRFLSLNFRAWTVGFSKYSICVGGHHNADESCWNTALVSTNLIFKIWPSVIVMTKVHPVNEPMQTIYSFVC